MPVSVILTGIPCPDLDNLPGLEVVFALLNDSSLTFTKNLGECEFKDVKCNQILNRCFLAKHKNDLDS